MSRLMIIRTVVDNVLANQTDKELVRDGFVHLYGVADLAALLALKRGLDSQLAAVAGMLHDIYTYRTGLTRYHSHNSEEEARVILRDAGCFSAQEQQTVRVSIFRHSDKQLIHEPFDELLKDADVLQRYLHDTQAPVNAKNVQRLKRVTSELGLLAPQIVFKEHKDSQENEVVTEYSTNKRYLLAEIGEQLAKPNLVGNAAKSGADVFHLIRYFPGTSIDSGFDWCASFVYHCCTQVGIFLPIKHPKVSGRFAGVKAWLEWAKLEDNNFYFSADDLGFTPSRGDIVIFDNIVGFGPHDHIGIVLAHNDETLITAEGNVENRSGIFTRDRYDHVNGFIRITNDYEYRCNVY